MSALQIDPEALPVPDLGLACYVCGYNLTGAAEHRCPECGNEFSIEDYIPPGAFPVLHVGGKPAQATPRVLELLKTYGITPGTELNPIDSALGFTFSATSPAHPTVPRDRYWEAVLLVLRDRRGDPLPDPPEPEPDIDWTCPRCEEENPGTFEVCWNCGESRGE